MPFSTEVFFQPPLCTSSSILAVFQLVIYIGLCVSLAVRYRHHVFSYLYTASENALTPKRPYEILVFLLVETYVLLLAAFRLVAAVRADPDVVRDGMDFSDVTTMVVLAYVCVLERLEEKQFRKYLAKYAERQAMLNDSSISKDKATEHGDGTPAQPQSLFMSILKKPLSWFADRMPEPTAENVHIRYHFRAAAKAVMAFAFMTIAQQEACEIAPEDFLNTTVSSVPLIMFLLGFFVVRATIILRRAAHFTRTELR